MKADSGQIELLEGVVQVSESLANKQNIKVILQVDSSIVLSKYLLSVLQVSLELRYGREDEELMGLQFCNEMILATVSILSNQSSISSETQSQVKI